MYMIMTDRGWRPFHALNKPCPNSNDLQGVYRPQEIGAVRTALAVRALRWERDIQFEEDRKNKFSGDSYNEPIFGAFGEKL